ncbi:hypothetical protein [Marinirhabdus gelatinilytica]|uniref:Lipoprotein n=1 Tax=Marinirhabdus gelatinilytica TaxID=1703343 RepID=A0A370QK55_9FLAO|nr:hypothetical protein [Marinirhabdus gelatinilytica]RDK88747.1 hypothetical protein C8D94_101624 [Marinirhabdus gelatinilytica]
MRYLLISVLWMVCTSCALQTTKGLRQAPVKQAEVVNPYFSETSIDYVYKAKIDVYGRYFGGILIVKKLSGTSHRVVFTTEFGSKIFDFLYEGDTFTKNFILEDLDKKIVVNTLNKDFRLLITEKVPVVEQYASEKHNVYRTEAEGRYNFYFFRKGEETLEKLVHTSKHKEKVTIKFESLQAAAKTSEENSIAEKISIAHNNIKLQIDLAYLIKD